MDDPELDALCKRKGYGYVMSTASKLWAKMLKAKMGYSGGAFVVGPCIAGTIPCTHPIKDKHGHCDICNGCGWITEGVAAVLEENAKIKKDMVSFVNASSALTSVAIEKAEKVEKKLEELNSNLLNRLELLTNQKE